MLEQHKQINDLRAQQNLLNYRTDKQEQYGRRESAKVINVDATLGDDAEKIIFDICQEIERKSPDDEKVCIDLQPRDLHRCHFMGEGSKRRIICKFTPAAYKKKMLLMRNKKLVNQARTGKFKSIFIAEDLTPTRSRLVWYIKTHLGEKYHKVHTRNGVIKMKQKTDNTNNGKWISVDNPDDLHTLVGDDFDVVLFNKGLHSYQVLLDLPPPELDILDVEDDADEEFADLV